MINAVRSRLGASLPFFNRSRVTMVLLCAAATMTGCGQRTGANPTATPLGQEMGLNRSSPVARGNDYEMRELVPGVGFGDIRLGASTLADVERILGTDHRVRTRNTTQACDPSGCRDDIVVFTLEHKRLGLTIGLRQDPEQGAPIECALVRTVSVDCNDPKACNFRGATSKGLRIGDDKDRAKELHGDIQARHPSGNLVYPEGLVISSTYQSNRIATLTLFLPDDIKRFQ